MMILASIVILSCCNNDQSKKTDRDDHIIEKEPHLPPGYHECKMQEFCDSLQARTRTTLQQGTIELVTDNYPRSGIDKRQLFRKVLLKRFKLKLLPIFDSVYYPRCIMPIMDSAISSKYGPNGKDSIITWVNHFVDSVFSK